MATHLCRESGAHLAVRVPRTYFRVKDVAMVVYDVTCCSFIAVLKLALSIFTAYSFVLCLMLVYMLIIFIC